jgi:glycosyltransferase involved in cell wall biosynthesis
LNILFVHEVDWLRKVVYEIHTLSELLSLAGHKVYAIDYESMWEGFGISKRKEMKVARVYPEALVNLIRPRFIKIPVLSRVSAFVSHYFEIERTIKEKKIDVIILYSVPTNGLQTIVLAQKYGIPVIFRSIDTLNQLVSNPILSKLTYLMERKVYAKADVILTISRKLSCYVVKMGAYWRNVSPLLLGVDTSSYSPNINANGLYQKWGLNYKDKIVVFVGTLPHFSGLDVLINKFPNVIREVPEAKLLVVGDGVQRPELEWTIKKLNLQKSVIITGFQPQEKIPQFINMATICVNPFFITGATKDIFPTKVIQYMACGKPVVSSSMKGLMDMIQGEEQGIVFAGNSIDVEIIRLLKSDDKVKALSQSALTYVRKNHSYDIIVNQLEATLKELA